MRLIFAGTPAFAAINLQALLDAGHTICAVYTQPDRPAGRGRKLTASPIKQIALSHNIPVEQPLNFKQQADRDTLVNYQADLMIVVAYGLLLPQAVLDIPTHGCINVHASLLPRWRGAAPIQRAILAGDTDTGVCIMQMEAGLDTGPVLARANCSILPEDTAQTLHDRLALLGAETLIPCLADLTNLQRAATPQEDALSCYAHKLDKTESQIDWQQPAAQLVRQIQAFNPWPIAQTLWQGNVFRIWLADIDHQANSNAAPGTIVSVTKHHIAVATGNGVLLLKQVQLPGKRAMAVADFINAQTLAEGDLFGQT
jgi:methionyl-tRNA formyltransferase